MPLTLINEKTINTNPTVVGGLKISELFTETLQGEGIYTGHPATFLRLQGCPVGCKFCDSTKIWTTGQFWGFDQIFQLLEKSGVVDSLKEGQHLVITGGSPLLQQKILLDFLICFIEKYEFKPFIELENECSILIRYYKYPGAFDDELVISLLDYVDCWNNSPKLSNSGVEIERRYKPVAIESLKNVKSSWFKFVINSEGDWNEIENDFIDTNLIHKDQIILMPMGANIEELTKNRLFVAELAMKKNVKFSDRLHINLYNTRTGV